MLKNKTEQNRNDEIYNQTGVTVKIHTNYDGVRATAIMLRSITASSPWWCPVIVVKQASDTASAVLRVKKRASSDILPDALSARPHQSLQPSFKTLSTRAIFMFQWIRRSFIHKTLALKSLFFTRYVTKICVFLWATIWPNITEHFAFRFWNLGSCIPDYIRRQELFTDFQQIPSSKPSI